MGKKLFWSCREKNKQSVHDIDKNKTKKLKSENLMEKNKKTKNRLQRVD